MYRDDDDEREGLWLLVMVKLQDDDGSRKQLASMYAAVHVRGAVLLFFFPVTTFLFYFSSLYEPMQRCRGSQGCSVEHTYVVKLPEPDAASPNAWGQNHLSS